MEIRRHKIQSPYIVEFLCETKKQRSALSSISRRKCLANML